MPPSGLYTGQLAAEADFGQASRLGKDEATPLSPLKRQIAIGGLLQQLLSDLLPQVDESIARVVRLLMQQSPEQLSSWGAFTAPRTCQ